VKTVPSAVVLSGAKIVELVTGSKTEAELKKLLDTALG